ncbi:hypothetical protein EBZ37_09475 [bacterium]|nr:hypothetical protein [bacterium]
MDSYTAPQLGTGVSASSPGAVFDSWDPAIWSVSPSDFPTSRYFESPTTTAELAEAAITPTLCETSTAFDGGLGTRSSPFLISNASQLRNMRCNPSASFRLTSNINLAGVNYLPVDSYTGVFDGAGYTISNLQLNSPNQYKLGLFNQLSGAVVKDLTLSSSSLTGAYSVGPVAGHLESGSVVLRCKSSGTVNVLSSPSMGWGPGAGGGLVGSVMLSIVAESSSSATVNAGHRSGGLIGQGEPMAMIWDSYATGSVNCTNMCGSLAGVMAWQSSGATSYSVGTKGLLGTGSGMSQTYLNPTSAQTSTWDQSIWDTTSGATPTLRP